MNMKEKEQNLIITQTKIWFKESDRKWIEMMGVKTPKYCGSVLGNDELQIGFDDNKVKGKTLCFSFKMRSLIFKLFGLKSDKWELWWDLRRLGGSLENNNLNEDMLNFNNEKCKPIVNVYDTTHRPVIIVRYSYVPTEEEKEEIKKQFISIDDCHVIFLFGEDQPSIIVTNADGCCIYPKNNY